MNKMKKITQWGLVVVLGGALGIASPAYAKECALNQSAFGPLTAATKNPSASDYLENTRQELSARKALLSSALSCAIEDATKLKKNIDAAGDPDGERARSAISNSLDNALRYYKLQLSKVTDLGVDGSKYFAKDLLAWRKGAYVPVAQTASNFLLWSENQRLIRAAKNRIAQMGTTVAILKLVENDSIEKKWGVVNALFADTLAENQNARRGLENLSPAEETIASMKHSLDRLSETYKVLSELVSEINALTSGVRKTEKEGAK